MEQAQLKKHVKWSDYTGVILVALVFMLFAFTTDTFLSASNLYSILYGVSIQFFAVIGFTFLIIMGEIDLAVGSTYCLSGIFTGYLYAAKGWPLWLAITVVLSVCGLFGYGVGVLVTRFRLNSMMVTLGSMSFVAGAAAVMFNSFMQTTYSQQYRAIAKWKLGGVHWTMIAMFLIAIILELCLGRVPIFRRMYYIGNNGATSLLYGIKVNRIKRIAFMISALTAALGGIISTSRISYSSLATGEGLEFSLITACVVGGASLDGGRGSILKSLLGMLLLAMLTNGLSIYRIDPFIQNIVTGGILILAVFVDVRLDKKGARR